MTRNLCHVDKNVLLTTFVVLTILSCLHSLRLVGEPPSPVRGDRRTGGQ
jgi:hypothetical protein